MTAAEEWVLWVLTMGTMVWSIGYGVVIWRDRPHVTYDECLGRYVANRGKHCQRRVLYIPPITPPFGQQRHSGTSRTYIERRERRVSPGTGRPRHHHGL